MRYGIYKGVKRAKTKTALSLSVLGLGIIGLVLTLTPPSRAGADSPGIISFESPYTIGSINGQDGWSSFGAAGLGGCALYDHLVATQSLYSSFGAQSLRMSNAVTSSCFGDQTFSKSLTQAAGESTAAPGEYSAVPSQNHFEAQWDFASATQAYQPDLSVVASPDRGDGARMSWVQMTDNPGGLGVNFYDYRDIGQKGSLESPSLGCSKGDNFFYNPLINGLDRTKVHTIKITIDFYDGPRNDVVKVYIDGRLKHTGTTWEDYFRWCTESGGGTGNPSLNVSRTVDSILFRTGGASAPNTAGYGFYIDNLSLQSSNVVLDN